jgi:hypothetical protein
VWEGESCDGAILARFESASPHILDRGFPEVATCFGDVCGTTARALLETWTFPEELPAVSTTWLPALPARLTPDHIGTEKARAVTKPRNRMERSDASLQLEYRVGDQGDGGRRTSSRVKSDPLCGTLYQEINPLNFIEFAR